MTRKVIGGLFCIAVMMFTSSAYAEGYNVNPGMWETTHEMKVTGVPPEMAAMMQPQQPRVQRECVKDDDFDFSPDDMSKECDFKSRRHSANKLSWDIKCTGGGGNSTGHGEVNFNGDTASGWFEMDMQGSPAVPMKIRNSFNAKRVGSC